jgi:hypothetical protein
LYYKELVNTPVRLRGIEKDRKGQVFDVFSDGLNGEFRIQQDCSDSLLARIRALCSKSPKLKTVVEVFMGMNRLNDIGTARP